FASNDVSIVDTTTNAVVATLHVGSGPTGVAVNPDGTRAYVAVTGADKVAVIDTASNIVAASIAVGPQPWGVAVNHAGTRVYVSGADRVSVIDAASNAVIAAIPTSDDNGATAGHDRHHRHCRQRLDRHTGGWPPAERCRDGPIGIALVRDNAG
ncbi:MAG: YncE family protein, partial [Rhodospirillaceae bacterium]